jgi:hypothetical protein
MYHKPEGRNNKVKEHMGIIENRITDELTKADINRNSDYIDINSNNLDYIKVILI